MPIVTRMNGEESPAPAPKEEDVATEIRDLRRQVDDGRYEVPANEVAEAVLFWHFGRPTDLFWAYGIPTDRQRADEARRSAR